MCLFETHRRTVLIRRTNLPLSLSLDGRMGQKSGLFCPVPASSRLLPNRSPFHALSLSTPLSLILSPLPFLLPSPATGLQAVRITAKLGRQMFFLCLRRLKKGLILLNDLLDIILTVMSTVFTLCCIRNSQSINALEKRDYRHIGGFDSFVVSR